MPRTASSKAGELGPCILEGSHVRLEPLRREHIGEITEAAGHTDWTWFLGPLRSRYAVDQRIADGLEAEKRGEAYAFAVRLTEDGRVVGSTSYLTVVAKYKRAEVGSTWYSRDCWGTVVNPECKYLLLKHAFEDWGAVRVQLVTDINNMHSQRAIAKLGAKLEGTMRGHGIRADGSVRDARLYSIVPSEWPDVRSRLLARIQAFDEPRKTN